MEVRLQYFDGCPNWQVADARLKGLATELGFSVVHEKIETPEVAQERSFRGSPTVLVDGRDPFADGSEAYGLACRVYRTEDGPAGSPTMAQLRDALT